MLPREATGKANIQITRWVLRGGRFAALPRQTMKGIDQDGPWKSLRRPVGQLRDFVNRGDVIGKYLTPAAQPASNKSDEWVGMRCIVMVGTARLCSLLAVPDPHMTTRSVAHDLFIPRY